MNKTITIFILVFAFVGGFLIFYNPKPVSNTQQNWESKTDDQPPVTVTITPIDILPESKEWKFNIVMDTHLVELDQDMTKVAVFVDDQSKEYAPLNWEGPVGGHHREGVLVCNAVEPMPKSVEIKIKDIGGIPERSFKWNLK